MKQKILNAILIIIAIQSISSAQNCICEPGWQADICLSATSDLGTHHFENMSIIFGHNFVLGDDITFENCHIKTAGRFIKYFGGANQDYKFIDCTIEGCNTFGPFAGFRLENGNPFGDPQLMNLEISRCTIPQCLELVHLAGASLIFNDNVVFNNDAHLIHYDNDADIIEMHGNYISGKADIIRISDSEDHLPLHIGSVDQRQNVFISTESTTVNGEINNNITIENTSFQGSSDTYIALSGNETLKLIECDFYESTKEAVFADCAIEVDNCLFHDNPIGLHSLTGEINIRSSNFEDNDTGIKVSLANQSTGNTIIEDSTFENEIDYFSTGATSLTHMSGNSFNGDLYSILADGENNYIIEDNNIDGSGIGSVSSSNGSYPNIYQRNSITNNTIGALANYDNSDLLYLDNCFGNISEDMNLDGFINGPFGDDETGAGNRFTESLTTNVVATSSVTFPYYYPMSGSNSDPALEPKGYVHVENSDNVNDENCGSALDVAPYFCVEVETLKCYEIPTYIQQLIDLIAQVQNNNNLSPDQVFVLTAQYNECLRIIRLYRIKTCGEIWPPISNPWWHEGRRMTTSIGNLIDMEAYVEAEMFIDVLEESELDEETSDFIVTQRINIARLKAVEEFEVLSEELSLIYAIAQKSHPLAAYARGLYTILTREVIVPDIIPFVPVESKERTSLVNQDLSISPTPAREVMHITVTNSDSEMTTYRLLNQMGTVVVTHNSSLSNFSIDVSEIPSGIYFMDASIEGQKISETKKCFITK